jgi:lipoate-protein ligase A
MPWRVIPYTEGEAAWNMAVDEAILEAFIAGGVAPTIRFYGWLQQSVTIGRLQPYNSVPEGWGTNIVRRPTGGRAVFHGKDLTFSIVVDAATLGSPVRESYRRVGEAVSKALVSLSVPAELCRTTTPPASVRGICNCFDLTLDYELAVEGRKTLGSAQVRRANAVLQQNSLANPSGEQWHNLDELASAIVKEIAAEFDLKMEVGEISESELQIARELTDKKYANDGWNLHSD